MTIATTKTVACCSNCKAKVKLYKVDEYHFDTAGIPNVWLLNVDRYSCGECGNSSVFIPRFGQLMTTLAEAIIFKNDSYTSKELFFLKKLFGLKSKYIAEKLGTSPKTVSFWMRGRSKVSASYGIKIRKLLMDEFSKHLKEKIETYKVLIGKMKKVIANLKQREEMNYRKYLKDQAQLAVKEKLATFASTNEPEVPTFRIPHSNSYLQLRS